MKTQISKEYAKVIIHRLNRSEVPSIERLRKVAPHITKKELRGYINKAKRAYDALLHQNDTKKNHKQSTTKER